MAFIFVVENVQCFMPEKQYAENAIYAGKNLMLKNRHQITDGANTVPSHALIKQWKERIIFNAHIAEKHL